MQSSAFLDDPTFDSSVPQVRTDAVVHHFDNEIVAWSSITAAPAYLDPVAALALQMLDGTASVADLIADVHEVLGIPKAVARSQLRRAISLLDDGGLLTSSTAPESPATDIDLFPAPPNP